MYTYVGLTILCMVCVYIYIYIYTYIYIYIYIYIYCTYLQSSPMMRDWRNSVEIVLFEISNSMRAYPSAFHAYTNQLRPAIVVCLNQAISTRFPTVFRPSPLCHIIEK